MVPESLHLPVCLFFFSDGLHNHGKVGRVIAGSQEMLSRHLIQVGLHVLRSFCERSSHENRVAPKVVLLPKSWFPHMGFDTLKSDD